MHLSKTRLENMTSRQRWQYLTAGGDPENYRKFKLYHGKNPHILEALEAVAREQFDGKWRKSSVWLILGNIRWGPGSTVDTESQYKISNNYFAYYSRLLIARDPRYANWIVVKLLKGQSADHYDSFEGHG